MKYEDKTKEQLIEEIRALREQEAEIERENVIIQDARIYAENIVKTVREPLLILNGDLRVISANRSFYDIFKVTKEETENERIYDLGNGQWDIPKFRQLLEDILPEQAVFNNFEIEHVFPVIGKRVVLLNACEIVSEKNKRKLILLAIEDVTEQKAREEKLRLSAERFKEAFTTARDGLLFVDMSTGQILDSNSSVEGLLDHSHEEFQKMKLWEIGISKNIQDFQEVIEEMKKSGFKHYKDVPVRTKKDKGIDAEVYLVDRAEALQCNIRDITERKKDEEAHSKTSGYLSGLFDYTNVPIIIWDAELRITRFNHAFERFTDYSAGEVIGQELSMLFPESGRSEFLQKVARTAGGERWEAVEIPILCKNGEARVILWNSANIYAKDGKTLLSTIAQGIDITERKKNSEKIRHLNRVLTAIRGVNQLITREKDPSKLISDSCEHLIKTGGYMKVWIALFGEKGDLEAFAADGKMAEEFPWIRKALEEGKKHRCQEMALEKGEMVVIRDTKTECAGCPMAEKYEGNIVFCAPLAYEERAYGTMSVALSRDFAIEEAEQGLFKELAGDISFALHGVEIGEETKRMQEERDKHLHELEVFYESAMGREDRILELKKEIEELKKRLEEKS